MRQVVRRPWRVQFYRSVRRAETIIGATDSKDLEKVIGRHARNLITVEVSAYRWTVYTLLAIVLLGFIGFADYIIHNLSPSEFPAMFLGLIAAQLTEFFLFGVLRVRTSRLVWIELVLVASAGLVLAGLLPADVRRLLQLFDVNFSDFTVAWMFIMALQTAISFVILLARRLMDFHMARNYPVSKLVSLLVNSCWLLRDTGVWTELESKRELMELLEIAASLVQTYIPRRLFGFDRASEAWISRQANSTASALREYKKWVYSPMPSTRIRLEGDLRQILFYVIRGEWHFLPQSEPPATTVSQVWLRATKIGSAILQSTLPLLLIFLWHLTPFRPSQDLFEKLAIAAVAIGAVYLLVSIDPGAETKIRGATSIIGVFTKGGAGER